MQISSKTKQIEAKMTEKTLRNQILTKRFLRSDVRLLTKKERCSLFFFHGQQTFLVVSYPNISFWLHETGSSQPSDQW